MPSSHLRICMVCADTPGSRGANLVFREARSFNVRQHQFSCWPVDRWATWSYTALRSYLVTVYPKPEGRKKLSAWHGRGRRLQSIHFSCMHRLLWGWLPQARPSPEQLDCVDTRLIRPSILLMACGMATIQSAAAIKGRCECGLGTLVASGGLISGLRCCKSAPRR